MEFKLRLKSIGLLFLIYTLFTCINWYTNLKEVRNYTKKTKVKLTNLEIKKYISNPDKTRTYYFQKKIDYVGSNSLIPYIVNKKLVTSHPTKIISKNCGC